MSTPHIAAIKILEKNDLDWRKICFEIAASNPIAFIDAVNGTNELRQMVIDCDNKSGKIAAIKFYREMTQSTLGEAKEYVEKVCEY